MCRREANASCALTRKHRAAPRRRARGPRAGGVLLCARPARTIGCGGARRACFAAPSERARRPIGRRSRLSHALRAQTRPFTTPLHAGFRYEALFGGRALRGVCMRTPNPAPSRMRTPNPAPSWSPAPAQPPAATSFLAYCTFDSHGVIPCSFSSNGGASNPWQSVVQSCAARAVVGALGPQLQTAGCWRAACPELPGLIVKYICPFAWGGARAPRGGWEEPGGWGAASAVGWRRLRANACPHSRRF
jgi:hypothetical protein